MNSRCGVIGWVPGGMHSNAAIGNVQSLCDAKQHCRCLQTFRRDILLTCSGCASRFLANAGNRLPEHSGSLHNLALFFCGILVVSSFVFLSDGFESQ